ncbi:MAG: hypothetical protein ACOCU8_01705 [Patescibacteria group bacterium]
MDYKGVIIEESLMDKSILDEVKIISTKVELVTAEHKTPWIKQWTLHDVEIPAQKSAIIAEKLSQALDDKHDWYADYKTDTDHFIIYRNKVFHITDRSDKKQYDQAKQYGISIGIPDYQVDFSVHIIK